MLIKLIDARRGLHNKCLELFADKKIAEDIYRKLCDGIDECETIEPKLGHWKYIGGYGYQYRCSNCIICAEHKTLYCPNCKLYWCDGNNFEPSAEDFCSRGKKGETGER